MGKRRVSLFILLAVTSLSSGCGGGQSNECKKLLACEEAISPGSTQTTAAAAYGPDGSCWKSSAQAAESCTAACQQLLETRQTTNPTVPECQ